jgi:hypothetical protein
MARYRKRKRNERNAAVADMHFRQVQPRDAVHSSAEPFEVALAALIRATSEQGGGATIDTKNNNESDYPDGIIALN